MTEDEMVGVGVNEVRVGVKTNRRPDRAARVRAQRGEDGPAADAGGTGSGPGVPQ